jgi:hypothetical protein
MCRAAASSCDGADDKRDAWWDGTTHSSLGSPIPRGQSVAGPLWPIRAHQPLLEPSVVAVQGNDLVGHVPWDDP